MSHLLLPFLALCGTKLSRNAPLFFPNGSIVNAGIAPPHQPIIRKLPQLVAVGSEPLAICIVPLVLKAHGHAIFAESPQFLLQPIVEFLLPFSLQELFDLFAAVQKLGAVSPFGVFRVRQNYSFRVASIPDILGELDFGFGA